MDRCHLEHAVGRSDGIERTLVTGERLAGGLGALEQLLGMLGDRKLLAEQLVLALAGIHLADPAQRELGIRKTLVARAHERTDLLELLRGTMGAVERGGIGGMGCRSAIARPRVEELDMRGCRE